MLPLASKFYNSTLFNTSQIHLPNLHKNKSEVVNNSFFKKKNGKNFGLTTNECNEKYLNV